MTKQEVFKVLRAHGLKRSQVTEENYIRAKQIIFGSITDMDTKEYENIVRWICDYLNY